MPTTQMSKAGAPAAAPPPGRSAPLYRASLHRALARFLTRYAVFAGRASRSEFWWVVLVGTVLEIAVLIVYAGYIRELESLTACGDAYGCPPVTQNAHLATTYLTFLACTTFLALALSTPALALTVRRLHDTNRSGHWMWLVLAPGVGALALHLLALAPSDPDGKRFDWHA